VHTNSQLGWLNLPHLPILPPPVTVKQPVVIIAGDQLEELIRSAWHTDPACTCMLTVLLTAPTAVPSLAVAVAIAVVLIAQEGWSGWVGLDGCIQARIGRDVQRNSHKPPHGRKRHANVGHFLLGNHNLQCEKTSAESYVKTLHGRVSAPNPPPKKNNLRLGSSGVHPYPL